MATLYEAMDVIVLAMSSACNAAGITVPSQTVKGWPVAEELTSVLAQQEYLVSLYDHGGKSGAKYINRTIPYAITPPVVNLSATVDAAAGSVGFFGTLPASGGQPVNIHTFVGAPQQDVAVQTIVGDTIASVVGRIVAGINALGNPFVTAAATGNGFVVTGSPNLHVNIGSSGTYGVEIDRSDRVWQAVVWSPTPDLRDDIAEAILGSVGTEDQQWYPIPNSPDMQVRYESDNIVDESQSDYSLYEHHIFFKVWLPRIRTYTATQVLGFQVTNIIDGTTQPVEVEG